MPAPAPQPGLTPNSALFFAALASKCSRMRASKAANSPMYVCIAVQYWSKAGLVRPPPPEPDTELEAEERSGGVGGFVSAGSSSVWGRMSAARGPADEAPEG